MAWRLGHVSAPLDFVPPEYCSWKHRFDDYRQGYRTLYAADLPITCLREVLQDLRPDTEALAEFAELFGDASSITAGAVTAKWRAEHVLASGIIDPPEARLDDITDPRVRHGLTVALANELREFGFAYFDFDALSSTQRELTQSASAYLHDEGADGLMFRSKVDAEKCFVLFEYRAHLDPTGEVIELDKDLGILQQVCHEFRLSLM